MDIEKQVQSGIFSKNHEKTLIDKLLGRKEGERLRELIQKKGLKREELLEAIHIAGNIHSKLLNYTAHDRYVNMKYYVWLREFIVICESFYDLQTFYTELKEKKKKDKDKKNNQEETQKITATMDKISSILEHTSKAMLDLYLNIGTTSMSLNGMFVTEALRNKFEVDYRTPVQIPEQKAGSFFGK